MSDYLEGKKLPFNLTAEQSVLGAIFIDNEVLSSVLETLLPLHFYRQSHQNIFQAMLTLSEQNDVVDIITVMNQMTQDGTLEASGGELYLIELSEKVPTARNVDFYVDIVYRDAVKRRLIHVADSIMADGYIWSL